MLVVIEKGKEKTALKIFEKWDLNCVEVGIVTNDGRLKVHYQGKLAADVPAETLVLGGGAPVYVRESKEPAYLKKVKDFDFNSLKEPGDYNEVLLKLLSSPNIANKNWVYEQYDTQVRTNTVILPGGDASVMRIKENNKALSMKTDCNGRYVYLNPYKGGQIAVYESARNVVCTGAEPLAITNCLNFGNPYKPEVYHMFREAVRGIGDACRVLGTPVTGGNVSFYNESPDYAVYPTPVIGMIGIIEDIKHVTTSYFKDDGDIIAVIGKDLKGVDGIGGSEYLKLIHNRVAGDAPDIEPDFEKKLQETLLNLIRKGFIKSAHDVSDGGFAAALAECCIINKKNNIGCEVNFEYSGRKDFELFSEAQSRVIISFKENSLKKIEKICNENNIGISIIGKAGGKSLKINKDINLNLEILSDYYYNSIKQIMES